MSVAIPDTFDSVAFAVAMEKSDYPEALRIIAKCGELDLLADTIRMLMETA